MSWYSYLTTEIKQRLLDTLVNSKNDGFFDDQMFDYCNEINKLDGVCTILCCFGHKQNSTFHISLMINKEHRDKMDHFIEKLEEVGRWSSSVRYLGRYGLLLNIDNGLVTYRFESDCQEYPESRHVMLHDFVELLKDVFDDQKV